MNLVLASALLIEYSHMYFIFLSLKHTSAPQVNTLVSKTKIFMNISLQAKPDIYISISTYSIFHQEFCGNTKEKEKYRDNKSKINGDTPSIRDRVHRNENFVVIIPV